MDVIGYSEENRSCSRRLKETNDCTVHAWSYCFDAPYEACRQWLAKFGRKPRRGPTLTQLKEALASCKKAKVKVGPYSKNNRITLAKFIKQHPKGRYFVVVRGHALCVKDGVVYDHSEKPNRQVVFAARVYLEGEV